MENPPEDRSALIKARLDAAYRFNTWTNDRVAETCAFLKCTLEELCAAAGIQDDERARTLWRQGMNGAIWPEHLVITFANLEHRKRDAMSGVTTLTPQQQVMIEMMNGRF